MVLQVVVLGELDEGAKVAGTVNTAFAAAAVGFAGAASALSALAESRASAAAAKLGYGHSANLGMPCPASLWAVVLLFRVIWLGFSVCCCLSVHWVQDLCLSRCVPEVP